jgi:penicillin-binding protein 2A
MSKIINLRTFLMKKIKKFLKVSFVVLLIFFSAGIIGSFSYFTLVTHSISLDTNKLEEAKSVSNLKVFDCNLEEIKPTTSAFIPISKLSSHTKNAFISAEDKRFYKHGGLDFVRIGGAIISNLKTKSFSEGASTISQQLIKNTQLSNEKTIKRKLKEFKLTKQLENKYSKDEILEMYLNNIYFGNGCYGIENASQHYFSKSATNLTLAESALLASTINAPSIYDIENNYEKAIERKNLIIDLMLENKKINDEEVAIYS